LSEEVAFDSAKVTSTDWLSYPILDITGAPDTIDIVLINRPDLPPAGAGESSIRPVAAALANAVFDATGVRLRRAPLTPQRLKPAPGLTVGLSGDSEPNQARLGLSRWPTAGRAPAILNRQAPRQNRRVFGESGIAAAPFQDNNSKRAGCAKPAQDVATVASMRAGRPAPYRISTDVPERAAWPFVTSSNTRLAYSSCPTQPSKIFSSPS
jgi:hypothetical protein